MNAFNLGTCFQLDRRQKIYKIASKYGDGLFKELAAFFTISFIYLLWNIIARKNFNWIYEINW